MEPLTKSKWKADEYDGWEMTGISAYLLSTKGAYRIPTDSILAFVLFTEIRDLRNNYIFVLFVFMVSNLNKPFKGLLRLQECYM